MKIAIISDIHDNETNLKKFLFWAKENGIEKIICCGDITNSETLEFLSSVFKGEIFIVRGNAEIYDEKELSKYDNIKNKGDFSIFEIDGKTTGACHEPFKINNLLDQDNPEIIFYGHTHKPWIEKKNSTVIVNPGTLGGVFSRATFAFWDTEKEILDLKILDLI